MASDPRLVVQVVKYLYVNMSVVLFNSNGSNGYRVDVDGRIDRRAAHHKTVNPWPYHGEINLRD